MKAKRILASVLSVALLLQLSPLGVFALDENLPQTSQVSTVQENLDPAPTAEPAPEETAAPTATPTPEPTAEPTATPAAPDAAERLRRTLRQRRPRSRRRNPRQPLTLRQRCRR